MQLVYTSRLKVDAAGVEGQKFLREIAENTRRGQAKSDISGVLLVGQDWLAQILEGEASELTPIFRSILTDERHEGLRLVGMRKTPERHFPSDCPIVRPSGPNGLTYSQLQMLNADDFVEIAAGGAGR